MDNDATEIVDTMVKISRQVPAAPAEEQPAGDDDDIGANPMDEFNDDEGTTTQPVQQAQVSAWIQQTLRSSRQAQAMQQRSVSLQMQASLAQPGFLKYMHQQLPPACSNHFQEMPSHSPLRDNQ